jgi:hypothetical protein
MPSPEKPVSRREFARRAAIGAASASLLPLHPLASGSDSPLASHEPVQAPANAPKLSPQSQAEAEVRWKAILEQYSDRLTDAQKADLKRLCIFVQPGLDKIRAYTVDNASLPGLYLKPLVERDKKAVASAVPKTSTPSNPAKH